MLNNCLNEDNPVEQFSLHTTLEILGRIPFDHELASLNSNAEIVVNKKEKYRELFIGLLETIVDRVENGAASHKPNMVHGKVTADDQKGHNAEQEKTCGENVFVESGEFHRELEGACSERDHTSNEMEGGAQ